MLMPLPVDAHHCWLSFRPACASRHAACSRRYSFYISLRRLHYYMSDTAVDVWECDLFPRCMAYGDERCSCFPAPLRSAPRESLPAAVTSSIDALAPLAPAASIPRRHCLFRLKHFRPLMSVTDARLKTHIIISATEMPQSSQVTSLRFICSKLAFPHYLCYIRYTYILNYFSRRYFDSAFTILNTILYATI